MFADPFIRSDAQFKAFVAESLPAASPQVQGAVTSVLYPPVYDGRFGYKNDFERVVVAVSEFVVNCNTWFLATAYQNATKGYQFSVPPALHGQDVGYTFYAGSTKAVVDVPEGITNVTVALTLQKIITSFTKTGDPGSLPGGLAFPTYTSAGLVANLNQSVINVIPDNANNPRCAFWEQGLFY